MALADGPQIAGYYTLSSASVLLADAIDSAARSEIAAFALLVDAKDGAAADSYRHHGFFALPDSPQTLFLPLVTARSG